MPSTILEQMVTKGFRNPNLTTSGPSAKQLYWDTLGYWVQPLLARTAVGFFNATTGTSFSNINVGGTTTTTISTPTLASTNVLTQCRRTICTTAAATSASASVYSSSPCFFVSNTSRIGGFVMMFRFANSTTVVGNRCFVGVTNVGDPVATANISASSGYYFGVGFDTGDAVASGFYQFKNNNGTQTKTQISAMSRTASTLHELWLWSWPGSGTIYMWAWDLTNDNETYPVASTSTNVPLDNGMYSTMALNTGTSASAVVMNWVRWESFTPW